MKVRPAMLLSVCLALAVGGCSLTQAKTTTPKASGAAKAIGDVISNLGSDAAAAEASDICKNILASTLVSHLNKIGGCTKIITNQDDTVLDFTLTVEKYGVRGNVGTAIVKAPYDSTTKLYTVHLVKQANGWRISGLSGG